MRAVQLSDYRLLRTDRREKVEFAVEGRVIKEPTVDASCGNLLETRPWVGDQVSDSD
jgi:hypothetical protein